MQVESVFLSEIDIIWYHELSDRFVDHEIYSYWNDVQGDMIEECWDKLCDFRFDIANEIGYSMHNCHDCGWECQIFMIYDKLFVEFDAWIVITFHRWNDDVVKKESSFWRKIDISMEIMRWNRVFIYAINSSFLSL